MIILIPTPITESQSILQQMEVAEAGLIQIGQNKKAINGFI